MMLVDRPSARSWLPLPPRLVAVLLVVTVVLRLTLARSATVSPWRAALGAALAIAGLSLTLSAARHFARKKTNIVTFAEPTRLVEDGWFRISRNPMYLGFALLLAGTALAIGGAWTFLPTALFLLAAERVYIPFEERAMAEAFGEDYRRYAGRVRRWLGRRSELVGLR
jgi:protein-S-isoprenylcysteine O-methyltransferase Ste14